MIFDGIPGIIGKNTERKSVMREYKKGWMIPALALGLALVLCACGGSSRDYEGEIAQLRQENVALTQQVQQLQEQLDQLKNTRLESWSLDARGSGEEEPAAIQFSARPLIHEEGQTAELLVMYDGMEEVRVPCTWDGESFSASLTLPAADGYGYYCILSSAEGAAEQITLTTQDTPTVPKLTYLKSSLSSYASATLTDARLDQNAVTANVTASVQAPLITQDGLAVTAEDAQLLWMLDDEVLDSCAFPLTDGETEGGYAGSASNVSFSVPDMPEGSQLSLMLSVQLSNGKILTAQAGSWAMTDGLLTEAVG